MKVGFDLAFLLPGAGGLETYSRRLIGAILERNPACEGVAFVTGATRRQWDWELDRLDVVELGFPDISSRLRWGAGQLALLPYAAHRSKIDVLHSLGNFGPIAGSAVRVLTVHDPPRFFRTAETPGRLVRSTTASMVALAARRAHRIITDSEQVRKALMSDRMAGVGERVDVVYPGVEVPWVAHSRNVRIDSRHEHRVLYVGTHLPHKNLAVLLRALSHLTPAQRPLVMMAGNCTDAGELRDLAVSLGVGDDVRFFGRVCATTLESLYRQADCLVSVALHEGFGLPLIEAMARRVPVLCSAIPVFFEVAGDAAVFVDPNDPRAIAQALQRLLADAALRRRLGEMGEQRAGHFTWAAAADATVGVYRRALESPERRSRQ